MRLPGRVRAGSAGLRGMRVAAGGGVAAGEGGTADGGIGAGAAQADAVEWGRQASEAAAVLAVSEAVQLPVLVKEEPCDPAGQMRELLRPYVQRLEEALEGVQELLRVFLQDEA